MEMRCYVHRSALRGVSLPCLPDSTPDPDGGAAREEFEERQRRRMRALRPHLKKFIAKLGAATEYEDYAADVALPWSSFLKLASEERKEHEPRPGKDRSNKAKEETKGHQQQRTPQGALPLWLVEINCPVYLCATSGLFSLELERHREALLGCRLSEFVEYPVMLMESKRGLLGGGVAIHA